MFDMNEKRENLSPEQRLQELEMRKRQLVGNPQMRPSISLWNSIEMEINPLSIEQQNKLKSHPKYSALQSQIMDVFHAEFVKLLAPYVESNPEGFRLLQEQLSLVRSIKNDVIKESDLEMNKFRQFQEAAKENPKLTWEDFNKQ